MDGHYHFGGGAAVGGGPLIPNVSAFSAYLRSCNYLLAPQPAPPRIGIFTDENAENSLEKSKTLINLSSRTLVSPPTFFAYPPQIHHVLSHHPNDPLDSSHRSSTSPSSPIYHSSFKRQRGEKKPIPEEQKDDKYFERRRRNNQAAKKSRDARKLREDQVALRATLLEHENAILRTQVLTLREETASLRQMLLQKKALELATRDSVCRP